MHPSMWDIFPSINTVQEKRSPAGERFFGMKTRTEAYLVMNAQIAQKKLPVFQNFT